MGKCLSELHQQHGSYSLNVDKIFGIEHPIILLQQRHKTPKWRGIALKPLSVAGFKGSNDFPNLPNPVAISCKILYSTVFTAVYQF